MRIIIILGSVASLFIIQVIAFWASGGTKNGVIDGFVAWGTLMLAGATFWTIWQNYKFREKDRKERLLNEIIEWAIDVTKCGSSVNIQSPHPYFKILAEKNFLKLKPDEQQALLNGLNKDEERIWRSQYAELVFKYQVVDTRGEYILNVSSVFPIKIYNTVKEVKEKLEHTYKMLWDYTENISNESSRQKARDYEHELQDSGKSLIKVITGFKTKDIN